MTAAQIHTYTERQTDSAVTVVGAGPAGLGWPRKTRSSMGDETVDTET